MVAGRILILPKGEYNSSTTYDYLDLVTHGGSSWLCKKKCTDVEPSKSNTDYWQIVLDITAITPEGIVGLDEYIDQRIQSYIGG